MEAKTQQVANIESLSGWDDFVSCFPSGWREIARRCDMLKGLRQDKDLDAMMRTLMLHLACNYSLRETSAKASSMELADLSDVAIMKRLQKSGDTFKELCQVMFERVRGDKAFFGNPIRLVDATHIKEPGRTGTSWRMHYSFSLSDMTCDGFKLSKTKGSGTGEGFEHFEIRSNDIMVADRGYSRFGCFKHVADAKGYSCVRWNSRALPLYCLDGEKQFDIRQAFNSLPHEGMCRTDDVLLKEANTNATLQARVCIIRKSDEASQKARRQFARNVSRDQIKTPSELALLACDFVVVVTTLPEQDYPTKKVLDLYRLRWQIELVFKRFKSLAKLGALPKYTDKSAKAWLYGKMFLALLIEHIGARLRAFSPWRDKCRSRSTQELLERICCLVAHRDSMDNSIVPSGLS